MKIFEECASLTVEIWTKGSQWDFLTQSTNKEMLNLDKIYSYPFFSVVYLGAISSFASLLRRNLSFFLL